MNMLMLILYIAVFLFVSLITLSYKSRDQTNVSSTKLWFMIVILMVIGQGIVSGGVYLVLYHIMGYDILFWNTMFWGSMGHLILAIGRTLYIEYK